MVDRIPLGVQLQSLMHPLFIQQGRIKCRHHVLFQQSQHRKQFQRRADTKVKKKKNLSQEIFQFLRQIKLPQIIITSSQKKSFTLPAFNRTLTFISGLKKFERHKEEEEVILHGTDWESVNYTLDKLACSEEEITGTLEHHSKMRVVSIWVLQVFSSRWDVVVSIGLFWLSFMPFSYNGVPLPPSPFSFHFAHFKHSNNHFIESLFLGFLKEDLFCQQQNFLEQ